MEAAILKDGLQASLKEHPAMKQLLKEKCESSETYQKLQADLESTSASISTEEMSTHTVPKEASDAEMVVIQAVSTTSSNSSSGELLLQVKPGTDRLELGIYPSEVSPPLAARWRRSQDRFEHIETGLFLDAPVKYHVNRRGEPWELPEALFVRPEAHTMEVRYSNLPQP